MKLRHPQSGLSVVLAGDVVSLLMEYRQIGGKGKEAGGQLFARFSDGMTRVEFAGRPKKSDRRWWSGFIPCRKTERREIAEQYRRGLHFVGDWHTHPELVPIYSGRDLRSIRDCLTKSRHSLEGLLMVIAGYADNPKQAIRVWFVSQHECVLLDII